MIAPEAVLHFWFGDGPLVHRPVWFRRDATFDHACTAFRDAAALARSGALEAWTETPRGTLALLLLLDQFPRNLHRGLPDAFAADPQARTVARTAIARGFDLALRPVQRCFVYLPFEHSEDMADQELAVRLFTTLAPALGPVAIDSAERHREVIRRFGRFPHRNAALGRVSTPSELAYLAEPGSGF
jgi:uncharacterized protein (DUF924 family)